MTKTRQNWLDEIRAIRNLGRCAMNCPGCGSSNVTGDSGSWICHNCGAQGQS